ncbi:MAG: diaminopimelate epimerase, partial [Betaproteobacteria bacterium]|nr:diaminopimelate epimerase [Betaproteobacteria bacterium]
MKLRFTKMEGAGNDFVMIDATQAPFALGTAQIARLADRHFGVGADQVLVVERPTRDDADFKYRIFNADGHEVEHCGNGARCFVVFVRERGLSDKTSLRVQTMNNLIVPELRADGRVTVDMGAPRFDEAALPFDTRGLAPRTQGAARLWPLDVGGQQVEITAVSMGNPHAVQIVSDVEAAPVSSQGPLIERHARFAQGVNASYMQVVDAHTVKLRVYERGAGETLACGTGACAAVAAGVARAVLCSPVDVHARG